MFAPRVWSVAARVGGWTLAALLVAFLTVTLPMPMEGAADDRGGLLVVADLRGRALVLFDPDRLPTLAEGGRKVTGVLETQGGHTHPPVVISGLPVRLRQIG